jgi:hypothetical protein
MIQVANLSVRPIRVIRKLLAIPEKSYAAMKKAVWMKAPHPQTYGTDELRYEKLGFSSSLSGRSVAKEGSPWPYQRISPGSLQVAWASSG